MQGLYVLAARVLRLVDAPPFDLARLRTMDGEQAEVVRAMFNELTDALVGAGLLDPVNHEPTEHARLLRLRAEQR